jgi:hypothetical protein
MNQGENGVFTYATRRRRSTCRSQLISGSQLAQIWATISNVDFKRLKSTTHPFFEPFNERPEPISLDRNLTVGD